MFRYEAKCIKDIVGTILDKLLHSTSVVDENLVGMGARLQDLKLKLKIGSGGVRMVGIWGIGGGGKTTLASSLYMQMGGKYDGCCFLESIKDESSKLGMKTLQEKILSSVFDKKVEVESVEIGKNKIKGMLGCRNVLIVLDDVDDHKQLEALAGSHDWFGDGSRLIITTRDEHLLRAHKVDEVSHVNLLSHVEAIQLFNKHAYNVNNLVEDYEMISQHFVSYAGGLPLALKVLGSFLCDKDKDEWISTLSRLKDIPEMEIVEILKISYDGLTPLEKELFLDIACFYSRRMEKDEAMVILEACGFHPGIGVKVLMQKGLITINSDGQFDMHDLIQEMGLYIVRGEHPNNPEKHTRLWLDEEIDDMYKWNTTMENNKTEAIQSYICPSTGFGKFLSKAKKLRMLIVYNLDERNIEVPEYLSNELRYLYWRRYPTSPFPESFQLRKLVVLKLEGTLQKELWRGYKYLPCLKELHVSDAENLVRTPDFGGLPCLEKLTIEDCPKLKRIEGNFHALKHLHKCKIEGSYRKLVKLPKDLFNEHIRLEELHLEYTSQPSIPHLPCFLRKLTLNHYGLEDVEIPCDIGGLFNLQELDLSYNDFSRLNISLLQLTQLKLLNLSNCWNLVELPELPTSIAILKADGCKSLEVVGDIINKNCKWLCQVSLRNDRWWGRGVTIYGGERLLETMLQGNAIENGCMILRLGGVEMTKGLIIPRLVKGNRYRLELPDKWSIHFSGFLFSAVQTNYSQTISMKHEKSGSTTGMDSVEKVYWKESKFDDMKETWVGYVSFGLLKHTTWWHPTSTSIHFKIEYDDELCDGFGVRLVPKTGSSELQTTTSDSSSQSSNHYYKPNFKIRHDSESHLECTFNS